MFTSPPPTLRTLANVYGEDTVRRAVGIYARRYRFAHPARRLLRLDARGPSATRQAPLTALDTPSSVDFIAADLRLLASHTGSKPGFAGQVLVRRVGEIRLPVDVLS
ncbi:MAG: hypothetical protein R3B70_40625 [Polyangiaceae bacterium]